MAEPFESPKLQDFDCISMQTPRERFQAALNFFRNSFPNAPYSSSTVNFDGNSYRHESTFSSAIKSRTIQHTNDCSDVLLQNQVTVPSNPVHLLHSTGLPLLAGTIVIAPSLVVQDTLTCHALQVLVNNPLIGDVHVDPLSVTAVLVPNILIDKRGSFDASAILPSNCVIDSVSGVSSRPLNDVTALSDSENQRMLATTAISQTVMTPALTAVTQPSLNNENGVSNFVLSEKTLAVVTELSLVQYAPVYVSMPPVSIPPLYTTSFISASDYSNNSVSGPDSFAVIQAMSPYLPRTVLERLCRETRCVLENSICNMSLQHTEPIVSNKVVDLDAVSKTQLSRCLAFTRPLAETLPHAAMLLADVSGFTKLNESFSALAGGAEHVTTHLNRYFTTLLDIVERYGGDVVKFAGDALIVLFMGSVGLGTSLCGLEGDSDDHEIISHHRSRLDVSNALRAAQCALELQEKVGVYDAVVQSTSIANNGQTLTSSSFKSANTETTTNSTTVHVHLSLHIAVAPGDVHAWYVGGEAGEWEFILTGPPFQALEQALTMATTGQVVVSPSVWNLIRNYSQGKVMQGINATHEQNTSAVSQVTALHRNLATANSQPNSDISSSEGFVLLEVCCDESSISRGLPPRVVVEPLTSLLKDIAVMAASKNLNSESKNHILALLQQTAAALLKGVIRNYVPIPVQGKLEASQGRWLAELRRVTVIFLNLTGLTLHQKQSFPVISVASPALLTGAIDLCTSTMQSTMAAQSGDFCGSPVALSTGSDTTSATSTAYLSGLALNSVKLLDLTHLAVKAVQKILIRNGGYRRQFLVDDKGTVLIACFGVPPFAHEDDAYRAIKTVVELRRTLLGMQIQHSIGVATGNVYIGSVGSASRKEHAVVGDTVNSAARHPRRSGFFVTKPRVIIAVNDASLKVRVKSRSREREHVRTFSVASDSTEASTPYFIWRSLLEQVLGLAVLSSTQEKRIRFCNILELFAVNSVVRTCAPLLNGILSFNLPETPASRVLRYLWYGEAAVRRTTLVQVVLDLLRHQLNCGTGFPKVISAKLALSPSVWVVENMNDVDAQSVALLLSVMQNIKSILLLVTARPQEASSNSVLQSDDYLSESVLAPLQPLRGWSRTEFLSLGTLDISTTCAIVCYRLGIKIMPSEVGKLIMLRAKGNPLYAIEIAYALRQNKLIAVDDNGRCSLNDDVYSRTVQLPGNLKSLVTQRIDRLPAEPQLLCKIGSVFGSEFSRDALFFMYRGEKMTGNVQECPSYYSQYVGGFESALQEQFDVALLILERTSILTCRPDQTFSFCSILLQRACYDLLLLSLRVQLHHRIAEYYETCIRAYLSVCDLDSFAVDFTPLPANFVTNHTQSDSLNCEPGDSACRLALSLARIPFFSLAPATASSTVFSSALLASPFSTSFDAIPACSLLPDILPRGERLCFECVGQGNKAENTPMSAVFPTLFTPLTLDYDDPSDTLLRPRDWLNNARLCSLYAAVSHHYTKEQQFTSSQDGLTSTALAYRAIFYWMLTCASGLEHRTRRELVSFFTQAAKLADNWFPDLVTRTMVRFLLLMRQAQIDRGTDGIEGAITAHSFNSAYMLIEPMIPIDMSASDPLRCFCDTLVPLLFVLAAYQIQTGALVEAAKLTHWLQRLVEYWPTLSCVTMGVTAADHCYSSWQPREGQHCWLRLLHLQLQTRLSLSGALFGPCIQSVRQHMPMIEALGAMHLDKWRSPYFLQLCSTIIDVLNLACLAALYVCSEPNAARLLLDWQAKTHHWLQRQHQFAFTSSLPTEVTTATKPSFCFFCPFPTLTAMSTIGDVVEEDIDGSDDLWLSEIQQRRDSAAKRPNVGQQLLAQARLNLASYSTANSLGTNHSNYDTITEEKASDMDNESVMPPVPSTLAQHSDSQLGHQKGFASTELSASIISTSLKPIVPAGGSTCLFPRVRRSSTALRAALTRVVHGQSSEAFVYDAVLVHDVELTVLKSNPLVTVTEDKASSASVVPRRRQHVRSRTASTAFVSGVPRTLIRPGTVIEVEDVSKMSSTHVCRRTGMVLSSSVLTRRKSSVVACVLQSTSTTISTVNASSIQDSALKLRRLSSFTTTPMLRTSNHMKQSSLDSMTLIPFSGSTPLYYPDTMGDRAAIPDSCSYARLSFQSHYCLSLILLQQSHLLLVQSRTLPSVVSLQDVALPLAAHPSICPTLCFVHSCYKLAEMLFIDYISSNGGHGDSIFSFTSCLTPNMDVTLAGSIGPEPEFISPVSITLRSLAVSSRVNRQLEHLEFIQATYDALSISLTSRSCVVADEQKGDLDSTHAVSIATSNSDPEFRLPISQVFVGTSGLLLKMTHLYVLFEAWRVAEQWTALESGLMQYCDQKLNELSTVSCADAQTSVKTLPLLESMFMLSFADCFFRCHEHGAHLNRTMPLSNHLVPTNSVSGVEAKFPALLRAGTCNARSLYHQLRSLAHASIFSRLHRQRSKFDATQLLLSTETLCWLAVERGCMTEAATVVCLATQRLKRLYRLYESTVAFQNSLADIGGSDVRNE